MLREGAVALIEWVILAIGVVVAYVGARFATRWCGALGERTGVMSFVNERSSHTKPTSRLGGVGIGVGIALGVFVSVLGLFWTGSPLLENWLELWGWLGLGWLGLFTVGLLDDRFDLPPKLKLGLMLPCLALPLVKGLVPEALGIVVGEVQAWLILPLAFGWLLFFTNAFNFMDGMDGFAGSFAVYAAVGWLVLLIVTQATTPPSEATVMLSWSLLSGVALVLMLLIAACGGFLRWNWPPARVFMGDAGSLSTGLLLAALALGLARAGVSWASSLALLMPFVFDVSLTLVRRARRGESLMRAHREHLYQRLMQTGRSHRGVLLTNHWLFAGCGLAAVVTVPVSPLLGLAITLILNGIYWMWVLRCERRMRKKRMV